jgi:hypothetical protein
MKWRFNSTSRASALWVWNSEFKPQSHQKKNFLSSLTPNFSHHPSYSLPLCGATYQLNHMVFVFLWLAHFEVTRVACVGTSLHCVYNLSSVYPPSIGGHWGGNHASLECLCVKLSLVYSTALEFSTEQTGSKPCDQGRHVIESGHWPGLVWLQSLRASHQAILWGTMDFILWAVGQSQGWRKTLDIWLKKWPLGERVMLGNLQPW